MEDLLRASGQVGACLFDGGRFASHHVDEFAARGSWRPPGHGGVQQGDTGFEGSRGEGFDGLG